MTNEKYVTVTALTKYIKYKFDMDKHLKKVLLKGEISNFKRHSRGHFYFTLKDESAQISAIMFASSANKVIFKPIDGMSVLVEGYITVYEASGNYQIYVKKMSEDGVGNLYLAYEQLKKELSNKGLFDDKYKQPVPKFPKRIGVLTSPTGAAVKDVIHIINRRYPLCEIIIYPTLVQGANAKDSIINNIVQANKDALVDVIILGRGGGSIEDLWPFNEAEVAYKIFESHIPIISSVGHETDFTISDFVADLRAPTPSGGAEIAVPDQMELLNYLTQVNHKNMLSLQRIINKKSEQLLTLDDSYVFRDPMRFTERKSRTLDHLMEKLALLNPTARLTNSKLELERATEKLHTNYKGVVTRKDALHQLAINKLELLNPLSIMKKGYSVVKQKEKIIKSITDVATGELVEIDVHDGTISATVTSTKRGR